MYSRSEQPAIPHFQSSEYDMCWPISVVSSLATLIGSEDRQEAKPGQLEWTWRLWWVLFQQGAAQANCTSSVPGGHLATYRKSLPENEASKWEEREGVAQKWMETDCQGHMIWSSLNLDLPLDFTVPGAQISLLHLPSSSCHLEFNKPARNKLGIQASKRLGAELLWTNK